MDILVKMASEEELHELTNAFKIIDKDGTGLIKAHELSEVIQHHNLAITENDISRMIKESDYAGNG
jgi:Ca2+-binding EF-hand superfamily protein